MQIDGKVAAVTGAGSGIGRASALALAERGAGIVFLADIDEPGLATTAELVTSAGAKAEVVPTDVTDVASQRALYDTWRGSPAGSTSSTTTRVWPPASRGSPTCPSSGWPCSWT